MKDINSCSRWNARVLDASIITANADSSLDGIISLAPGHAGLVRKIGPAGTARIPAFAHCCPGKLKSERHPVSTGISPAASSFRQKPQSMNAGVHRWLAPALADVIRSTATARVDSGFRRNDGPGCEAWWLTGCRLKFPRTAVRRRGDEA
ncbi:hypothetical protein [Azohydromonas aeria]|uniref:hypothetical protein n=1 Tax=Azohydromonas aeria TaxID=2590212 RepID=UPI0012FB8577|nr:hypothetical protein [Azohydromonas aeria]